MTMFIDPSEWPSVRAATLEDMPLVYEMMQVRNADIKSDCLFCHWVQISWCTVHALKRMGSSSGCMAHFLTLDSDRMLEYCQSGNFLFREELWSLSLLLLQQTGENELPGITYRFIVSQ